LHHDLDEGLDIALGGAAIYSIGLADSCNNLAEGYLLGIAEKTPDESANVLKGQILAAFRVEQHDLILLRAFYDIRIPAEKHASCVLNSEKEDLRGPHDP